MNTLFIADKFIIDIFNPQNGVISLQLMNNDANLKKDNMNNIVTLNSHTFSYISIISKISFNKFI